MSEQTGWSIPIDSLVDKMTGDMEKAARKVVIEAFDRIVKRSPVGNARLWKGNEDKGVGLRAVTAYQNMAEALNAAGGGKRVATGKASINKKFPLAVGKGYVGGRFRANWNVSVGAPNYTTTDTTAYAARNTEERAKLNTLPMGNVYFLANGLPYSTALERGHSKQAPQGMVRLTALELGGSLGKK